MTVLVLDIGSSSVRAMLIDQNLQAIPNSLVRRTYQFDVNADGGSTIAPERIQNLVERCIDEVIQHPHAETIEAVGMATFVGNLLGIDDAGNPVTPILTYADDRSRQVVSELKNVIDANEAHQRTGCPIHPAYHPSKLHWFKQEHPEQYEQIAKWMDIGTYLYQMWFGVEVPCSYSIAAWSGLLNHQDLCWDRTWLDALEIDERVFPKIASFRSVQSGLSPSYAKRWVALRDVPFYLPISDGYASQIGSGGRDDAQVVLSLGTTAALRRLVPTPLPSIPSALWQYRVDDDSYLVGGATSEGGNLYQWIVETLGLTEHELGICLITTLTRSAWLDGNTLLGR